MTTDQRLAALDQLLGPGTARQLDTVMDQLGWAEDEITRAHHRHPERADLIHHAFPLLAPAHELMRTEFVYRSHCAEILERVAAGTDTRPGTAAEICAACHDASQIAPLNDTAFGLYARMWQRAFPHKPVFTSQAEPYEALYGQQITDLETLTRAKLAQPGRRLTAIDCTGTHHGQPVTCTATSLLGRKAA
jgi:hypothetical protein